MTATDSSKAKNNARFIANTQLFNGSMVQKNFLRRKCKISLVRRTGFVLPLEHPSGTKYVNSTQLQRFLDKNDKSPIRLFQCCCFPDLQEAAFGSWLLIQFLQPLLLVEVRALYYSRLSLTIFSTFSALPLQTKTGTTLLFLGRHLNPGGGGEVLPIMAYTGRLLVICFVTSYPRMTGLVNG